MGHSTYQQSLGGDMRHLEELLVGVAKSDEELLRKIGSGKAVQLFDLACGVCNNSKTSMFNIKHC